MLIDPCTILINSRSVRSELFAGCSPDDVKDILKHAGYFFKTYARNEEIFRSGNVSHAGLILTGGADIIMTTSSGRDDILFRKKEGSLIGLSFCITGQRDDLIRYRASSVSELLFIDINHILMTPNTEQYYRRFILNFVSILSSSNNELSRKINILTQKTLKDKLLFFFRDCAKDSSDGKSFVMPFTREQLAQFICSERTSVCRELGIMQDEGLIRIEGKKVILCGN